jgi:hypothetical protein
MNRREATAMSLFIFCFAAIGFVWSAEACARLIIKALGL